MPKKSNTKPEEQLQPCDTCRKIPQIAEWKNPLLENSSNYGVSCECGFNCRDTTLLIVSSTREGAIKKWNSTIKGNLIKNL